MDVQTIDAAATAAYAPQQQPSTAAAVPPLQPVAPAPPAAQPAAPPNHRADHTLHEAMSQLTGNGSNVTISFEVSKNPNEIVTVFKNSQTGEVISQFPAETMVLIAQFFNKLAGAVVDRSA